ncbi:hypothetical protein M0804_004683, partial [Polistes exclamans]
RGTLSSSNSSIGVDSVGVRIESLFSGVSKQGLPAVAESLQFLLPYQQPCRAVPYRTVRYRSDPPMILVRPQSQQVKAGGIASFYCTAQGAPPPTIHWRKNGKRITASQSRYLVQNYEHGALLRIEPVRAGRDSTTYECVAENGVGDAVSAEALLTVYEGKSFILFKPLFKEKTNPKSSNINDHFN